MGSRKEPSSQSTVSLDVMNEKFEGGIPNVRVMIRVVTFADTLGYQSQLESVEGVTAVSWFDDSIDVDAPLD